MTDFDLSSPPSAMALLRFWFGSRSQSGDLSERILDRWRDLGVLHLPGWNYSPIADQNVARQFGDLLESAARGECDDWLETATGRLAYIILCDQLPRSIYRRTARAYAFDEHAQRAVIDGLAVQDDCWLDAVEQAFYFMPLVHSEDVSLQRDACKRYAALCANGSHSMTSRSVTFLLSIFSEAAQRHCMLVEQFGRFPHRNQVLDRQDTPLEKQYKRDPWRWFSASTPADGMPALDEPLIHPICERSQ